MFKKIIITAIIACTALYSCNTDQYKETDSGLNYRYVKSGEGPAPEDGDVVFLNISYLDKDGNKLFSTSDNPDGALPLVFSDSMFIRPGGIEEGIKMIKEGDSLHLQFPIEDLYENTFDIPLPDSLVRGSNVTICMGAEDVMTMEEFQSFREKKYFEEQQQARATEGLQFETDTGLIDDYLEQQNIEAKTHESGIRYRIIEEGDGPIPQNGQTVRVNYTGKLLNGNVFDTSNEELARSEGIFNPNRAPYEPISFELGTGGVIPGWDIGFGLIKEGSKAEFYIPSKLAYGPRQISPTVPANSIMVFNVELVEILN